jgi:hypothetical protein
MPKARRSRKNIGGGDAVQSRPKIAPVGTTDTQRGSSVASTTSMNRPFLSPTVRGPQSLVFPGMVMAGCWLMAFTLFYYDTDPNHVLFAGMAVLMALLWTYSFSIRVRKLLLLKSTGIRAR